MQYTVTITSQGQITIPAKIRRHLGWDTQKTISLRVEDKNVVMEKPKDILDLAGTFTPKRKPVDPVKIRAYMEKHYTRV